MVSFDLIFRNISKINKTLLFGALLILSGIFLNRPLYEAFVINIGKICLVQKHIDYQSLDACAAFFLSNRNTRLDTKRLQENLAWVFFFHGKFEQAVQAFTLGGSSDPQN